jgi:hypothetical protein
VQRVHDHEIENSELQRREILTPWRKVF